MVCREVLSDVFLPSNPELSTKSALFIAWGQLLTYDLSLTRDNASEPFDVPCSAVGEEEIDVWCPLGAASEEIAFFRLVLKLSAEQTRFRPSHCIEHCTRVVFRATHRS